MKLTENPIIDSLMHDFVFIDNEMQDAIKLIGFFKIFGRKGVGKRSGTKVPQLLFTLLVWPFLKVESISSFCGKFVTAYYKGGKDVLYRFLRREDINWRSISGSIAKKVFDQQNLRHEPDSAFVVDDTLKHRKGKKVEGASCHFDHTLKKTVLGQQVLQLGLVTGKGFLPLDQQIYISGKKEQGLQTPFKDMRSAVAKDHRNAQDQNKNQMLRAMLRRAIKQGIVASHLIADTWFGNKGNIKAAIDSNLIAIFMMRRGNVKYRFQGGSYTAKSLYALVRRKMHAEKGHRFLTYSIIVEINLSEDKKVERWQTVKLVFSKPRKQNNDSWVVLLSTEIGYTAQRVLEVYALRWSIEVYFKEVKQSMGWMMEQTGRYTVHYASIHLTAIRYSIIYNLLLENGSMSFGTVRDSLSGNLQKLSYCIVLWSLFKAIFFNILESFKEQIGKDVLTSMKNVFEISVEDYMLNALQIDDASVSARAELERLKMA